MNRDVLQATVIDTAARVLALESIFEAYVSSNESTSVSSEVMMNFYASHIEFLRQLSLELNDKPYPDAVGSFLIKKSLESQDRFDRLLDRQRRAEELDPM